jgi:hypothetical protein
MSSTPRCDLGRQARTADKEKSMTHREHTRKRALVLATAAALALSACSDSEEDEAAAPPVVEQDPPAVDVPFTEENAEEFDGASVESVDPRLLLMSVSVRDSLGLDEDIDDTRAQFVDYCFSTAIDEINDVKGFALLGFDTEQRIVATGAELNEDNRNCVVAAYPVGTDVSAYSLGTVRNSVVSARDGEVNIKDAEPLTGIGSGPENELREGATTAPELVRVEIDGTLDQARYVFDEDELTMGSVGPEAFGYYTLDGTARAATSIVSIEDSSAVVAFEDGQLEDAVRFFTLPGAVIDRQRVASNLGVFGARTTAADLVSITRNSPAQYDFTFDEAVNADVGTGFALYTSDAQQLLGGAVTRPDEATVRVTFSQAADFDETIVRGAVAPQAVSALDADGISNTIGAERIRGAGTGNQGVTSGPDLIDVVLEADTGRATFVFDETLVDDSPVLELFSLVTESGEISSAKEIVDVIGGEVTGNAVVVLFDEADAEAAALATVGTGAVLDQQGNRSPVMTTDVRTGEFAEGGNS